MSASGNNSEQIIKVRKNSIYSYIYNSAQYEKIYKFKKCVNYKNIYYK